MRIRYTQTFSSLAVIQLLRAPPPNLSLRCLLWIKKQPQDIIKLGIILMLMSPCLVKALVKQHLMAQQEELSQHLCHPTL